MKVKELIKLLKNYDQDLNVILRLNYSKEPDDIEIEHSDLYKAIIFTQGGRST